MVVLVVLMVLVVVLVMMVEEVVKIPNNTKEAKQQGTYWFLQGHYGSWLLSIRREKK